MTRRWIGMTFAIVTAGMAPVLGATGAGRSGGPWPMLLQADAAATTDLRVAMLQQRANAALERLSQTASPFEVAGNL